MAKIMVLCSLTWSLFFGFSWAQVDTAWVRRYNHVAVDRATAIIVDDSGNVYVTGWSQDLVTGDDWATIKYSSSGVQEWVRRYDGPENEVNQDKALDMAIDCSGNIYVTGYVFDGFMDYGTIKYTPSGIQSWVEIFGSSWQCDCATSITTDTLDNVYVTGYLFDFDYGTIKYDALGNQKWVAIYAPPLGQERATAIEVNNSGYVFVTGYSLIYAPADYATVKYDSLGNEEWVVRYNGLGDDDDRATAMAIDESGHTYVTGYSTDTTSHGNYATVKYDSSGNELWVVQYNGPDNDDDRAEAIVISESGNVYVTGFSMSSVSHYDYATVKYDSLGNEEWVVRYNGLGNDDDRATAMAIDESGNIYVTGWSIGLDSQPDYVTIKYDSVGNESWAIRYDCPEHQPDIAVAIDVDNLGNVYVTGYSGDWYCDYVTIKYIQAPGISEYNVARKITNLNILPNPCKTSFEIYSSALVERLEIYNIAGRLIREERLQEHKTIHKISVENMNTGVYFAKFYTTDFAVMRKILVLR
ncbi:MAG: SBBP repeat-containing protein [bacterium]